MPASVVSSRSRRINGAYAQQAQRAPMLSKHSARIGTLSSGRNSSQTVLTETSGEAGAGGAPVRDKQVIKFVYSQAVEKAFRRQYQCTQFGPVSAKPQIPAVEIEHLPEIYADFLMIATLLESNHKHVENLRARGELSPEKSVVKLPKMTFRNAPAKPKKKREAASTVPNLPPLVRDADSKDASVSELGAFLR